MLSRAWVQVSAAAALGLLSVLLPARAVKLSEFQLKAAFLYNFALFTEWPGDVGNTLNLCIEGRDPFGTAIDELQGKSVGGRSIAIQRNVAGGSLKNCQIVFISRSAIEGLPGVLDNLRGAPVLTVADSPGTTLQGVVLSMSVTEDKITFAANLKAAREARLNLSSKLLRLATEVIQ
jgi:YfiR/HmsC-like